MACEAICGVGGIIACRSEPSLDFVIEGLIGNYTGGYLRFGIQNASEVLPIRVRIGQD